MNMSTTMSLLYFLDQVYVVAHPGLAQESIKQMQVTARKFGKWLGRDALLADLTVENLRGFLYAYHEEGRAAPTVNDKRRMLLTFWRAAADEDLLAEPRPRRIARIKEPRKLPEAWTVDEIGKILELCRQQQGRVGLIPADDWWTSLILTLYDTGGRIGAIIQAATRDYQPDDRSLRIRADTQKDKTEQVFQISDQAAEAIARHYSRERELIWPWPHARRNLYKLFRERIIEPACVPSKRVGGDLFHKIRRTCISYLAKEDLMLAVRQADHCRPELTFKHYIDPRIAVPKVQATDVLPRPKLSGVNGGEPNGD